MPSPGALAGCNLADTATGTVAWPGATLAKANPLSEGL